MTESSSLLIVGGTVIDPPANENRICNILISRGRLRRVERDQPAADRVLQADGCLVVPGLIDVHVHLREPGAEHKETIASGSAAALAGGFTAVACMPNTSPPLDRAEVLADVLERIRRTALCRVYPIACLTEQRAGEALVDFEALASAGAVAFSDDGDGLADAALMGQALIRLAALGRPAVQHCEDPGVGSGVMNKGAVSRSLGLPGLSPLAEEFMIARDLGLAEVHRAPYHVAHISTRRAVSLVRTAKERGVNVTTEICPHHLLLTEESCRALDADFKMHPPLRTEADVRACLEGVGDGTIDMLVTDHAPHTTEEKRRGFVEAPPGIVGLETALALFERALIQSGAIGWNRLIELMSTAPARRFGLPGGTLSEDGPADVTLIDPHAEWTIDKNQFLSKGRNSPFDGERVRARVVATIVDGVLRYELGRGVSA